MARSLPIRRSVTQQRAKELRCQMNKAEQLVWSLVRDRRLGGLKFRRQASIGPYVADFFCLEMKLVVELDGESHDFRAVEDANRTRYLESLQLRVCRVSNADVFSNLEGVGIGIARAAGIDITGWLAGRPSNERSAPSP